MVCSFLQLPLFTKPLYGLENFAEPPFVFHNYSDIDIFLKNTRDIYYISVDGRQRLIIITINS